MKPFLLAIHTTLLSFGIDGLKLITQLMGLPRYAAEAKQFKAMLGQNPNGWRMGRPYPFLTDRRDTAGVMKGHYFHMDLWLAQQVVAAKPKKHLDVGSRLDGFVAHLATTMPVTVGDIRPVTSQHQNIAFVQLDLMNTAETQNKLGTYPSVSCLHTLEHMGLGRYGDPLNPQGDEAALATLASLTEKNGRFYFATPFGRERIEFNAQRVYGLERLRTMLAANGFEVETFAYIDDAGDLVTTQPLTDEFAVRSTQLTYGCALFVCRKVS